jgi:ankyrin repeat protein
MSSPDFRARALRDRDVDGRLPLHIAVARGWLDTVQVLADLSPEALRMQDGNGQTPLHIAAANGHLDVVHVLAPLSPEALREQDRNGQLPLHGAVTAAGAAEAASFTRYSGRLFGPPSDPWVEPILSLATRRVEALQHRDSIGGRTPLEVAAESGASLDDLFELLRRFPNESLLPPPRGSD